MDWLKNKMSIDETNVVEITDENFGSQIRKGKYFIKFYVPWCGICKQLAPTWKELAKTLRYEESVKIAQIDCTEYQAICQEFQINAYPTLLWCENGKKVKRYSGRRSHENLLGYVEAMLRSPIRKAIDVKKMPEEHERKESKNLFKKFIGKKKAKEQISQESGDVCEGPECTDQDNRELQIEPGSVCEGPECKEQNDQESSKESNVPKKSNVKDDLESAEVCTGPECNEQDENNSEEVCQESDGPGSACKKPDDKKQRERKPNDAHEKIES